MKKILTWRDYKIKRSEYVIEHALIKLSKERIERLRNSSDIKEILDNINLLIVFIGIDSFAIF